MTSSTTSSASLLHAENGRTSARYVFATVFFAASLGAIVFIALDAGIERPFTQVYDADLHYVYRAFRVNERLPEIYFDHTGYLYTQVLSWFLRLTALVGMTPAASLSKLASLPDIGEGMAQAVFAARIFSILLALIFCATLAWAARRLSGSALCASATALVVATSGGVAYHAITMRPELLSALFVLVTMAAVSEAQYGGRRRRFVWVAVCSGAAYLAILTKMQAIVPLLFVPPFAILAGRPLVLGPRERDGAAAIRAMLVAMAAFVGALPFFTSHIIGGVFIAHEPLPIYTCALLGYVGLCIAAYCRMHARDWISFVNGSSAVVAGMGTAFLINYLHLSHKNSEANARFIDQMKLYSPGNQTSSFNDLSGYRDLVGKMIEVGYPTLRDLALPGDAWTAMFAVAMLCSLGTALVLLFNNRIRVGLSVGWLGLTGIATLIVCRLRGQPFYEPYYLIFPLLGIALAWRDLARMLSAVRLARALIAGAPAVVLAICAFAVAQNHATYAADRFYTPHL